MELHDWCAAAKLVVIGLTNCAFNVTIQQDFTAAGYKLMLHFTSALQVFETWCYWKKEKRPGQLLLAASDMEAGNVRDSEWLKQVDGKIDVSVTKAVDTAVGPAVQKAVDAAVGPAVQKAVDAAVGPAVQKAVDVAVGPAVQKAVDAAFEAISDRIDAVVKQAMLEVKNEFGEFRKEIRVELDDMKDDLKEQGITIRRRHAPANSNPDQNV